MKITQEHKNCIGCGTCTVLCPGFWEMGEDNKARPRLGKKNSKTGDYEFEIEKKDLGCNKKAADACPVSIIGIKNKAPQGL